MQHCFICVILSLLDDFHHEMDSTESKMDITMKKMAKVMHMSNGKFNVDVNAFIF